MTGQEFIHAVNLRNELACHNLSIDGALWTPNWLASADAGVRAKHRDINQVPLNDLRAHGLPGAQTPRAANVVLMGAMYEKFTSLVDGYGRPIAVSDGKKMNTIDQRNSELAFEEGRRKYAPTAPSRTSCIWLADDSPEGLASIRYMFGEGDHIRIVRMRITHCFGLHRADAMWWDAFNNGQRPASIENYWTGIAHPDVPRWEYLLDGRAELCCLDDLEHIRAHGARFPAAGPSSAS